LREDVDAGTAVDYLREIAKAAAELAVTDLQIGSPPD
jgi:hypothetical protein